jgi:acetoacetyl-CoA synthetase
MRAFFRAVAEAFAGTPAAGAEFFEWHAWSVGNRAAFWNSLWEFASVIGDPGNGDVLMGGDRMAPPDAVLGPRWFPGARLNFAENLLRRRDHGPAVIYADEAGVRRELSFDELHRQASRFAAALLAAGVAPGDRVAGFMPNVPETVIAMLGTAWIGATWSSCSPDFGTQGVLDRFGQIEPRILVAADGYRYAGKSIECLPRVAEITAAIPTIEHVIIVPVLGDRLPAVLPAKARAWDAWLGSGGADPAFARMPFDHPLYIMYSSGTTGLPKCMVHGAGGTLLQHCKEHMLHGDLRPDERIFYFTTCGWMMWNWLVSALAVGATIVLYEGAPMPAHDPYVLWNLAERERIGVFGTSAKYLALAEKNGVRPRERAGLSSLRMILSTGSPLAPASFDYVERDVKAGVHVASISGGTDIISCFALGNPLLPVRRGEIQGPGLGMAVDVYDAEGRPLRGAAGELVCTRPFPSMPVAFWNDADGSKYRSAYFEHFPGVWRHGDWAEIAPSGGIIIYGRSDATLNPGGVRIGTAEIYRQVERFPDVVESIAIAQETDGDVRIVLFVRMREGRALTGELVTAIQQGIRTATSPHHVPRLILAVGDIPRTISGKITEVAVREAFHGRPVTNVAALANPAALDEYRALGEQHRR